MKSPYLASVCGLLLAATLLSAQEPRLLPGPQKEHKWLEKFVGEWETDGEGIMGPDQGTFKCKGTIRSRMLGQLWVVSESTTETMGMPVSAVQTIGYDSERKKYIGSWVDSMTSYLWTYEGTVDPTGKILTLEAEGPHFTQAGKTAKYRDTYEFKTPDHIVATSSMLGEDGKWVTFMTGNARRKKKE